MSTLFRLFHRGKRSDSTEYTWAVPPVCVVVETVLPYRREGLLDLNPIKTCARTHRIADRFDRAISGDSRQRIPSRVRQVGFILQLVVKPGLRREGDVNLRARASCAERENRD